MSERWPVAWTLGLLLGLSAVPAAADPWSEIAGSGMLRQVRADGSAGVECPLRHTEVRGELSGFTSRVWVTQTFANTSAETLEAIYTFPLPVEGAVDDFAIHTASGTIRGELRRRGEARQVYEQARSQGFLAALLEQERPNVFTQAVANLPPGEEIRVELSYVAPLRYADGAFELTFPTVVGPRFVPGVPSGRSGPGFAPDTARVPDASRITPEPVAPALRSGHDVSIALEIDAGVPLGEIESPLHEIEVSRSGGTRASVRLAGGAAIPNRDFVLRYRVASAALASGYVAHRSGEGDGYVSFVLVPPERAALREVAPREIVFLVDRSGSQAGPPLEKAKATMLWLIDHLRPRDVFQVVSFSSRAKFLFDEPEPATHENVARARRHVRGLSANGGTWMAEAVQQICAVPPERGRLRIIALMTDGYIGNDIEILDLVRNHCADARWFPFGTGNSVNRFLLDTMAQLGRGEVEYVLLSEDEQVIAERFQQRIDAPVLTDLALEAEGLELLETYPENLGDLWAQRPVVIHARYARPGRGRLTLRGRRGSERHASTLEVTLPELEPRNSAVASMWARARIDALLGQDLYGWQTRRLAPDLEEAIVRTALAHRLSTPFTSFVAVDARMRSTEPGRTVAVPVEPPQGTVFAGAIEEITVTARKREESMQSTPVALTAFSDADLADRTIRKLHDIGPAVPNLRFDAGERGSAARVQLRGVGGGEPIATADPGVAVYVDGAYVPRSADALLAVSDVQRIETLRGPQGTRSGRNTLGGAIEIASERPSFDGVDGRVEARLGNRGRLDTRLALSAPLSAEQAALRIGLASGTRDPLARNRASGRDLQDEKLLAGRMQLLVLPSDDLELELSADRSLERRTPRAAKCVALDAARTPSALGFASAVGLPLSQQGDAADSELSPFRRACREDEQRGARSVASASTFLRDHLEATGLHARLALDLDDRHSILSITSWRRYQSEVQTDPDGTALSLLDATLDAGGGELDALAQDLRLGGSALDERLTYVVGVYAAKQSEDVRSYGGSATRTPLRLTAQSSVEIDGAGSVPFASAFSDPSQASLRTALLGTAVIVDASATGGPFPGQRLLAQADIDRALASGGPIPSVFLPGASALSKRKSDALTYAAYTHVRYSLGDAWSATLGLRFTHERTRLAHAIRAVTPGLIGLEVRRAGELDFAFDRTERFAAWTPLFNLSYQPADALLLYATYSRGFQGGRFNAQANAPEETRALRSERSELYEVGIKSAWLDQRVTANAVLFWGTDAGLPLALPRGASGEQRVRLLAAETRMRGAELELVAVPTGGLELRATLGALDARYVALDDPDDPRARSRGLAGTPAYTLRFDAGWLVASGSRGDVRAHASWTHESATATDVLDMPRLRQGKHGELSARLLWSLPDGRTEVGVFGTNLLDREYATDAASFADSFGHGLRYFNEPRSWGLEIRRRF